MKHRIGSLLVATLVSGMATVAFAQANIPLTEDPNADEFIAPAAAPKPAPVIETIEPVARDIPSIVNDNEASAAAEVTFVTGGIGDDEKQAIEAAKADYNLHVMSASANGAFVGEAKIVITHKKGKETEEMLSVFAGPLLYVKLPAGSYTLDATLGEQHKTQSFTVAKGKPARIHLGWKVAAITTN